MKICLFLDLKLRTDLGRTLGQNLSIRDRLVRLRSEFAKSVTETSSNLKV